GGAGVSARILAPPWVRSSRHVRRPGGSVRGCDRGWRSSRRSGGMAGPGCLSVSWRSGIRCTGGRCARRWRAGCRRRVRRLPGAEAEADFGEFYATVAGTLMKLWMFVLRLSHSGRAFHVAFCTQAQEAFLEGHVLAFEHFGAVPARIRYDNLRPAVIRVLRG